MRAANRLFDLDLLLRKLESGPNFAMLRMTVAMSHAQRGETVKALAQLENALAVDPQYSAAWRLPGKLHQEQADWHRASLAYTHGLAVAELKGEEQLALELRVRLNRSLRAMSDPSDGREARP